MIISQLLDARAVAVVVVTATAERKEAAFYLRSLRWYSLMHFNLGKRFLYGSTFHCHGSGLRSFLVDLLQPLVAIPADDDS